MFIALYIALCLLVAFLATLRGLGFLGMFLLSVILTPVISLLVLLVIGSDRVKKATPAQAVCPHCTVASSIPAGATYCPTCGQTLHYHDHAPVTQPLRVTNVSVPE